MQVADYHIVIYKFCYKSPCFSQNIDKILL
jgi:hypothetical protein